MSKFQKIYFTVSMAIVSMLVASTVAIASANTNVDQLIIKYRSDVQSRMSQQAFRQMATRSVSGVIGSQAKYKRPMARATGAHVLKLPYSMTPEQAREHAAQIMQQYPQIEYAEPDYRRYAQSTVPNDDDFNQQWHLFSPAEFPGAANVVNAWDISKGRADIVVAVLDGGMTDHEDLRPAFVGGSLAESGYDMVAEVDGSGDGDGRDSDPSNPGTVDGGNKISEWHGTHVGGIIAARPDNGKFVAGVGWNTSLSVVRFYSEAGVGGYISDQVDGMLWAAGVTGADGVPGVPDNPHPAHVLNMSIGSDVQFDCSRTEQNAINIIRDLGVSVVVAAGNENKDVKFYAPGNCKGVIAVTGVMRDGAREPRSNYGELIDIAAPGDKIHSTFNDGKHAPTMDSSEGKAISGTSQAAPQVSGVIALMLAANENLLDTNVVKREGLVALLESKLKHSARAFPTMIDGETNALACNENQLTPCVCTTATCGAGLLDAYRAVQAVTTKPQIKLGEDRDVEGEASVQLDASGSKDDGFGGEIVRYQWEQIAGPTVMLENSDQSIATFVAPAAGEENQVMRFKITATDDVGLQGSRQLKITVPAIDNGGNTGGDSGGGGSLPLWWLAAFASLLWFRRLG